MNNKWEMNTENEMKDENNGVSIICVFSLMF